MITILPYGLGDIEVLAANLRPEEEAEVRASHGKDPLEVLKTLEVQSAEIFAIKDDDVLLGLTGVVPYSMISDTAFPWMLTTPEMPKRPRVLVKYTKLVIARWLETWSKLENHIDARYTQSLRWARWAGFTVDDAQPYGHEGRPFHHISVRRV